VSVPPGPASQTGPWDYHIARAQALAGDSSAAAAILSFYADLARFQQQIMLGGRKTSDLRETAQAAAGSLTDLLGWLHAHAPAPLAQAAAEGLERPLQEWTALLTERMESGLIDEDGPAGFIVEAVLQPFVERAARLDGTVRLKADPTYARRCPICRSAPVVAALREEGQGAKRSLVCSLCFTEWDYSRIQCPACEENRFDALPVYTADAPDHVRVDACDSCRTYIKTVDLTRDGLAVPIVDDLASLTLDLWARQHGYQRLYPNLLRL
jgi:FdhE protein